MLITMQKCFSALQMFIFRAESDFASSHYTLTGPVHTASRQKLRLHALALYLEEFASKKAWRAC